MYIFIFGLTSGALSTESVAPAGASSIEISEAVIHWQAIDTEKQHDVQENGIISLKWDSGNLAIVFFLFTLLETFILIHWH